MHLRLGANQKQENEDWDYNNAATVLETLEARSSIEQLSIPNSFEVKNFIMRTLRTLKTENEGKPKFKKIALEILEKLNPIVY